MYKSQESSDAKDRTLEGRSAHKENFVVINRTGDRSAGRSSQSTQRQQVSLSWNDCSRETATISPRELTIGGILEALIEETRLELEDLQNRKKDICQKENNLKDRLDHLTKLKSVPEVLDLINTKINDEEE